MAEKFKRTDEIVESQQQSPLLGLPPELRNMIYELVFKGQTMINGVKHYAPGILLACKKIYHEATLLFYQTATFYFDDYKSGLDWYINISSKHRNAISHMRFDFVEQMKKASEAYSYGFHMHLGQTPMSFGSRVRGAGVPIRRRAFRVSELSRTGEKVWLVRE